MIHKIKAPNGITVFVASFHAQTREGKQVVFIVEGPPVAGMAANMCDKAIMTAVFGENKPFNSDCIYFWVFAAETFRGRTIETYNCLLSEWPNREIETVPDLSDIIVEDGLDVHMMIDNCQKALRDS